MGPTANSRVCDIRRLARRMLSAVQFPPTTAAIRFWAKMSAPAVGVPGACPSPPGTSFCQFPMVPMPPRRVTWPLIHSIASTTSGASNCTTLPSSETSFAPFDWARMTCQSVPRCGVNPTKSKPSPCFLVAFCAATSRSCQVIGSLAGSTPFSLRRPVAYHMNTISGCCIIPQTRPFQVIVSYADGNIDALSHLSRLIKSSRGADAPFEA